MKQFDARLQELQGKLSRRNQLQAQLDELVSRA